MKNNEYLYSINTYTEYNFQIMKILNNVPSKNSETKVLITLYYYSAMWTLSVILSHQGPNYVNKQNIPGS